VKEIIISPEKYFIYLKLYQNVLGYLFEADIGRIQNFRGSYTVNTTFSDNKFTSQLLNHPQINACSLKITQNHL